MFCEADKEEILNIKRILRCFEVMSGLKVNFQKSVVCRMGIEDDLVNEMASALRCSKQRLPLKYLGLSIGASPRR